MNNHLQVGPLTVGPHTRGPRDQRVRCGCDAGIGELHRDASAGDDDHLALATSGGSVTFTFASSIDPSTFMCYLDGSDFGPYEACASPGRTTISPRAITPSACTPWARSTRTRRRRARRGSLIAPPPIQPSRAGRAPRPIPPRPRSPTRRLARRRRRSNASPTAARGTRVRRIDVGHGRRMCSTSSRARSTFQATPTRPVTRGWIYYSQLPDTSITSGPSGTLNITGASFTYQATNTPSLFECSLARPTGNPAFTSCAQAGVTYTNLAEGTYTFAVRSSTNDGTTDATPAQRTLHRRSYGAHDHDHFRTDGNGRQRGGNARIRGEQSGVTFTCRLDNNAPATCTSPSTYSGLADGAHTFSVSGTDRRKRGRFDIAHLASGPDGAGDDHHIGTVGCCGDPIGFDCVRQRKRRHIRLPPRQRGLHRMRVAGELFGARRRISHVPGACA